MDSKAWLAMVLGAVLLYVLWGLDFTVSIDPEGVLIGGKRPDSSPPASASLPDAINWSIADEMPVTTLEQRGRAPGDPARPGDSVPL